MQRLAPTTPLTDAAHLMAIGWKLGQTNGQKILDRPVWTFPHVMILRIIDGDTFTSEIRVAIDFDDQHVMQRTLRLMASSGGVDAPELHDKDPAIRQRAVAAMNRVTVLMPVGTPVVVHSRRVDSFSRFLAQVALPDGRDLGDVLLAEGFVVPFNP